MNQGYAVQHRGHAVREVDPAHTTEQGGSAEWERRERTVALAPPIRSGVGGAANILALQRSAGNAAVAAMLGGERSAPAPTIQRSPNVEFTPSPHRVSLGETRLLPG